MFSIACYFYTQSEMIAISSDTAPNPVRGPRKRQRLKFHLEEKRPLKITKTVQERYSEFTPAVRKGMRNTTNLVRDKSNVIGTPKGTFSPSKVLPRKRLCTELRRGKPEPLHRDQPVKIPKTRNSPVKPDYNEPTREKNYAVINWKALNNSTATQTALESKLRPVPSAMQKGVVRNKRYDTVSELALPRNATFPELSGSPPLGLYSSLLLVHVQTS